MQDISLDELNQETNVAKAERNGLVQKMHWKFSSQMKIRKKNAGDLLSIKSSDEEDQI